MLKQFIKNSKKKRIEMKDRYKILLELLNKLRAIDVPNKAALYDNLIDCENEINNSSIKTKTEIKFV